MASRIPALAVLLSLGSNPSPSISSAPSMDFNGRQSDNPTLDDDILLYIFELAVRQDPRLALKLTHTCNYWRGLCLASSFLWSYISVVNDFTISTSAAVKSTRIDWYRSQTRSAGISYPDFCLLQHHIYHSKSRVLDVEIDIRMPSHLARNDESTLGHGSYEAYHHRTRMIGISLSQHIDRIRSLKVKSDTYKGFLVLFEALETAVDASTWSQLEDCQVQWTGSIEAFSHLSSVLQRKHVLCLLSTYPFRPPRITPSLDLQPVPLTLPKLTKVVIRGIFMKWTFFAPTNLEELYISDMNAEIKPSFRQLKDILLASQQTLKVLSLIDVCSYSAIAMNNQNGEAREYPVLHTMHLGYAEPRDLYPLATHLRLPALNNLKIRNVGGRRFERTTGTSGLFSQAEITYFASTHSLFTRIASSWNMQNLDLLTLEDILFLFNNISMPPDPLLHLAEVERMFDEGVGGRASSTNVGSPWYAAKMLLPFDFWQKCVDLKHLVLVRPDSATLYSLCCPAPGYLPLNQDRNKTDESELESTFDYNDGSWIKTPTGSFLRVPLPKLESFKLIGLSKEKMITTAGRREGLLRKIVGGRSTRLTTAYIGQDPEMRPHTIF